MTRSTTSSSTNAANTRSTSSSKPRSNTSSPTTSPPATATSKTSSKATRKTKSSPTFKVVHKFADGTEHAVALEDHIFQLLGLYARMYLNEDLVLREQGREKLRDVAKIVAKSEGASAFGKMLKDKQVESLDEKHDYYERFLDDQTSSSNTKVLAARLRKEFQIKSERASEDRVREWKAKKKKLRAADST